MGVEEEEDNLIEQQITNITCNSNSEMKNELMKIRRNKLITICLNAQSCASLDALDGIKSLVQNCGADVDFLIISETWYKQNECNIYDISGFNAIHDCRKTRRGGGLSIYVNKKWSVKNSTQGVISNCSSVKIEVTNNNRSESLSVIGVYRPPNHDAHRYTEFLLSLELLLEASTTGRCIIGGDLNIDLDRTTSAVRNYTNIVESYGFKICNSRPTRLKSNTRIDHLISNFSSEREHTVLTVSSGLSDHEAIIAAIEGEDTTTTRSRTSSFTSYSRMRAELSSTLRQQCSHAGDVNNMYAFIRDSIANAIRNATSTNRLSPQHRRHDMCPWLKNRPVIDKLLGEKDQLWRRYKRSGRTNMSLRDRLKRLNIIINEAKAVAKNDYYTQRFGSCRSSKQTWDVIKTVLRTKLKTECITELYAGQRIVASDHEIANEAAKYFATIGTELSAKIERRPDDQPNKLGTLTRANNSFFLRPATTDEVTNIILRLDGKKASGIDKIDARMLKACANEIAPSVTELINLCFSTGTYLDELKVARVVAKHKGGDRRCIDNYRPISILPTINKIIERCIYNRINGYLIRQHYFHNSQHGFRTGRNTQTATSVITNRILNGMDKKQAVSAIFMDLSKAFDCVPHTSLITKLEFAGIRGIAGDLMRSYLESRRIRVDIWMPQR